MVFLVLSLLLCMPQIEQKSKLEFIALMASLMSMVALAIDAILPALSPIGITIQTENEAQNQLLITMIFLGLGFGQLITGPISDSLGRKPVIYMGFIVFVIASFLCVFAPTLEVMIVGRILQGVGLSSPRTISIAMIRDRFSGNYMAKIMSFVVAIFILVPIVAPTIGKIMLDNYGWQSIFYSQLILGVFVLLWLWRRQPETLSPDHKKKFKWHLFVSGTKEFMKYRQAIIFTVMSGFVMGSFMVFLSTSHQIFQIQYQFVDEFPYLFGALAFTVGIATFANGNLVLKYGMLRLVQVFSLAFVVVSVLYIALYFHKENPPIYILMTFFAAQFFSIGFLFGNLRSLAMEPLGHIAGIGAAINGFLSTVLAVPLASYIGSFVHETVLPIFLGFAICGFLSLLLLLFLRTPQKALN